VALDDYAGLKGEIADYLNRGTTLDAKIPTFIRLTESRLNKVLDDPEMEVTATAIVTGQYLGLPDDFGELKSIGVGGYRLRGATVADFSGFSNVAGLPRTYGIYDGQLAFAPVPSTGENVTLVYTRRIPGLSDTTTTNWLLEQAPEAYLYGSLLQAEAYLWNDERLPTWREFYSDAVATLQADGAKRKHGAAPLAPRLGRT
jgi:hypothetical protein